jgi:hypothetical protein
MPLQKSENILQIVDFIEVHRCEAEFGVKLECPRKNKIHLFMKLMLACSLSFKFKFSGSEGDLFHEDKRWSKGYEYFCRAFIAETVLEKDVAYFYKSLREICFVMKLKI